MSNGELAFGAFLLFLMLLVLAIAFLYGVSKLIEWLANKYHEKRGDYTK